MLRNYPQNYDLMIEVPYKSMVNEFIRLQRARLLALLKYSQFIIIEAYFLRFANLYLFNLTETIFI